LAQLKKRRCPRRSETDFVCTYSIVATSCPRKEAWRRRVGETGVGAATNDGWKARTWGFVLRLVGWLGVYLFVDSLKDWTGLESGGGWRCLEARVLDMKVCDGVVLFDCLIVLVDFRKLLQRRSNLEHKKRQASRNRWVWSTRPQVQK
jgi:hypothetical protein